LDIGDEDEKKNLEEFGDNQVKPVTKEGLIIDDEDEKKQLADLV